MFRKPVERAIQGDRIGLCVTQFDPDKLERGLIGELFLSFIFFVQINNIDRFQLEQQRPALCKRSTL